jgi:AbrB family looped-hinge helix DNA binding protein
MPEQIEMTKLSTKGQIVLPLRIRNSRAWNSGMEFTVEEMGDGILLRPISALPPSSLDMVAGCLRYKGKPHVKPKTLSQMRAAIAQRVAKRHKLGRS